MMRSLFWLSMVMAFCVVLEVEAAKARTWTSASGSTVSASYAGFKDGSVILEKEDGARLQIGLDMLIPADQAEVRKLALAAGHISDLGTGAITPATTKKLPAFADGIWKGNHTVYESDNYRAIICSDGRLTIQPRENGADVGVAVTHQIGVHYSDLSKQPPQKRHTGRRLLRFDAPPKPAIIQGRKHSVTLKGVFEHEVAFVRTFEFEPTKVQISLDIRDPSGIQYPSVAGFGCSVPRSLDSGKFDTLEAVKSASKGWEYTLNGRGIPSTTTAFWQSIQKPTHGVASATFKGPWGRRVIRFDMPPSRINRDTTVYSNFGPVYPAMSALDGFGLGRSSVSLKHGAVKVNYTITIQ